MDDAAFRCGFEQAGIGMAMIAPDGAIEHANARLGEIVGVPACQLLGRPFAQVLGESDVAPRGEVRIQRADGTLVWVRITRAAIHDGRAKPELVTVEDLEDSHRASATLRRDERLYRAIARNLPNGAVLVFDHDLRYVVVEGGPVLQAAGHSKDVIGKRLQDVALPENLPRMEAAYRAALAGEVRDLEVSRNGRVFAMHLAPLRDEQGRVAAGMMLAYDVTSHKRIERQLQGAVDRLGHAFENSSDGIATLDSACRFVSFNPSFAELYAWLYQHEPEVGEPADLASSWDALFQNAKAGQAAHDLREVARGDEKRTLVATMAPLSRDGRLRAVSLCVKDVTGARRTELAAVHDELTGLLNRRGFLAEAKARLDRIRLRGEESLLFFLDLDGMKEINDRLGHSTGDAALVETAELLRSVFRQGDVVGRLGGDEFVAHAICPAIHASSIEARLRDGLRLLNGKAGRSYELRVSLGVSVCSPGLDGPEINELLERADAAMYEQKRRGRDCLASEDGPQGVRRQVPSAVNAVR